MIPEKIIIWCGWIFICSVTLGLLALFITYILDKIANRLDQMCIRNTSTDELKRVVLKINNELELRGEVK